MFRLTFGICVLATIFSIFWFGVFGGIGFFDILRGLEYFASVKAAWDPRLEDAVTVLLKRGRPDGRWPVQNKHSGRVWFDMETGRQPSRWNTLRALRVRRWLARVNG